MNDLFSLEGRVCVVTGGTKGIGAGTAARMLQHGATVVVTGRIHEEARKVADDLNNRFGEGRALGLPLDLAVRETGRVLVETVAERVGRIDTLMCNAAYMAIGRLDDLGDDLEKMDESFQQNVRNYASLTRHAIPVMKRQGGGSVIYILSNSAFIAAPPFLPYAISKLALDYMTRAFSVQYGPDNIRFNALAPGSIATGRGSGIELSGAPDRFVRDIPIARRGHPDDVAGMAILLSSAAGAYITGQTIMIDGGMTLKGSEGITEGYDMAARYVAQEASGRPVSD